MSAIQKLIYKYRHILMAALAVGIPFVYLLCNTCSAANKELEDFMANLMRMIFVCPMLDEVAAAFGIQSELSGYTGEASATATSIGKSLNTAVSEVGNALGAITVMVALLIILVGVCSSLSEDMLRGDITIDMLVKAFLRGGIAIVLIGISPSIMVLLGGLGDEILAAFINYGFNSTNFTVSAGDVPEENQYGMIAFVLAILCMILPTLIINLLMVIVRVYCYSLIIEIALRTAFMNIAIAQLATDHGGLMRNPGYQYMKSYLGVYLRKSATVLISLLCVKVAAATEWNFSTGKEGFESLFEIFKRGFTMVGLQLAGLIAMFRTDNIIKEAL